MSAAKSPTFCITFNVVTEESSRDGDFASHGWWSPGGWMDALEDENGRHENILTDAQDGVYDLDFKTAIKEAKNLGIHEDAGRWFSSVDDDVDIRTGDATQYALHPDGVTPSTYQRIKRLLNRQPIFGGKS